MAVLTAQRAAPRTLGAVSTWRERADNASQVIAALGSVRSLAQTNIVAEGTGAFLLANPSFSDESVELAPSIVPGTNTKLFFESRLGYATTSQFARAQVSTNGGANWITAWSQTGSGGAGDGGFRLVTVPLGTYAGISLRVRFFCEFTSGYAYTDASTSPPTGWFIDDIQIGESFSKRLYAETGEPTADEVLMLEFINRARADAAAEAQRLAATTDPDVLSAVNYFGTDRTLMISQRDGFPAVNKSITVVGGLNVKADYRGESVRIESVNRPSPTTVRVIVSRSGPSGSIQLKSSPDLQTWSDVASTQTVLTNGRTQLDTDIGAGTTQLFKRVQWNWTAP